MWKKILFFITCTLSLASTWGPIGHISVASIAQNGISSSVQNKINGIIPSGNLSAIANWADEVRTLPEWKWSAPLHFINTPDWACNYIPKRDCYNNLDQYPYCVDGAITNYTNILQKELDTDALKFLVHFVGDIHQPLHCGFGSDLGGNSISVHYNHHSTNLHSVWDTYIIEERIDKDFNGNMFSWIQYLINQSLNVNQSDSEIWGNESANLACKYSYIDEYGNVIISGNTLDEGYYSRNIIIIESQIKKAGIRLANLLNTIL